MAISLTPPPFPSNFTSDELTAYGTAVGTMFGGFVLAAVLLSVVMICVFIKFCCTSPKESQEYKKKIHLGISVALSVIAIVGCGVGWGYNKQCNDGVKSMTGAVNQLFNGSVNLIDSMDLTIINISAALDSKTRDMSRIPFGGLMVPIDTILVRIDEMQDRTNGLYDLTEEASDNVTIIQQELDYINEEGASIGLGNLPTSSDIPNITDSFGDSVRSGNNSLNDMRNTTLNVKKSVNDSLTDISDNLIGSLNAQTDSYHNKVNDLTQNFDNMRNNLENFETTYNNTYKPQVNSVSETRTAVVNGILILPIVVAFLSAGGVYFRMPKLLGITCALGFIFFFWYVLIAGINYTFFVVTDGFCASQNTTVNKALDSMGGQFTVPGTNNSYSTGQKVGELIQCKGDNTIIAVLQVGFLITDLETQVKLQAQNISRQAHSMNFDQDYKNATQNLVDIRNSTVELDYAQNKNLTTVLERIGNNSRTLNESIYRDTDTRDNAITNIDYITMNTEKNDNTPVAPTFYTVYNVSALDCNDTTWTDTKNQTELCNWEYVADVYVPLVAIEHNIYNNLTDVDEKVEALQTDVVIFQGTQQYLHTTINQVQGLLDQAYGMTNSYIAQIDAGVDAIYYVIADGANALQSDTNCAFIGTFYSDFSGGFCQKLSPSLQVISAMMMLGATTLFGAAVLSAVSIYKIKGSGEDDDYDDDSKA